MNLLISSSLDKLTVAVAQASPYLSLATSKASQIISKIGLSELVKIAFLYQLYDDAIANILALETNRHGTSIYSYAKIHLQGAKTCYGGHVEDGYQAHSANRFFVFEDHASFFGTKGVKYALGDRLSTHISAMGYSQMAYQALAAQGLTALNRLGIPQGFLRTFELPIFISSIPLGIFSPSLKFRFTPEQLRQDFKPDNLGGALYTEKDVSITHLGISGSLIQGVNLSVFKRIYHKPSQFLFGCVQLTAAIALTCIYTAIATPFPVINSSITVIKELMDRHHVIKNIALGALFTSTF